MKRHLWFKYASSRVYLGLVLISENIDKTLTKLFLPLTMKVSSLVFDVLMLYFLIDIKQLFFIKQSIFHLKFDQ